MVLRNRLANHLCPYYGYGSEIVYPIAEQSDEHQASSHGPDTVESDEEPTGSRSPLLVRGQTSAQWKDETFSTSSLEKVYQSVFQKHFGSESEVGERTSDKRKEGDSDLEEMASSEGEWDLVTHGERHKRKKHRMMSSEQLKEVTGKWEYRYNYLL